MNLHKLKQVAILWWVTQQFLQQRGRQSPTSALLDCRGYLTYSETHILACIACADRFNRKREVMEKLHQFGLEW
jgi:hypothetical protein